MKVETLEDAPIATTDPSIMRVHTDHMSNRCTDSIAIEYGCAFLSKIQRSRLFFPWLTPWILFVNYLKEKRKLVPNLTVIESFITISLIDCDLREERWW